jgi:hypothetical protein
MKGDKNLSTNLKSVAKALSLALVLLMLAIVGSAQTENVASTTQGGSATDGAPIAPAQAKEILSGRPASTASDAAETITPQISGQFDWTSVWWVTDPGGQMVNITINVPGVKPSSRVFASICEYSTSSGTCFQGAAYPWINNVIPQSGSVRLTFNPNWTAFLVHERFSLLIDP